MNKKKFFIGLIILGTLALIASASGTFAADGDTTGTDLRPIGAGLALGLAGIGAAIGMGNAGSAGIGALVENPELFGKVFLFIVLIEAVAIYGLLIAILLVF
ncbi:MAG: hypothetical protein ACTSQE_07990 [Candidatus Heimdallarchaeaceae archaeon]